MLHDLCIAGAVLVSVIAGCVLKLVSFASHSCIVAYTLSLVSKACNLMLKGVSHLKVRSTHISLQVVLGCFDGDPLNLTSLAFPGLQA